MSKDLDYEYFSNYFKRNKTFHIKSFDLALEHVQLYADKNGLSEEDLIIVTKVAFKQQLGLNRMRKVIKSLIPTHTMPDIVIETVLDWFLVNYKKNISISTIKLLLQWFIGIIEYGLADPIKHINFYYDLFYYFISMDSVNIPACKLIYLLTKPQDVRRWYVKQILKVHNKFNCPKYTGAVLLLFKSYRPQCVPESIPAYAVEKAFGVIPEFMIANFSKAQMRINSSNMLIKDVDAITWHKLQRTNERANAIKLIPNIFESEVNKIDGSKSLTSIVNFKDLHAYIITESTPNRVLSLLNNDEGSFILAFGNRNLHERFSYQLYHTLYDAFFERNSYVSYEEKNKILYRLSVLQNQLQQSIPVVSKFLTQFIVTWDGFEHETNIYNLLEWFYFKSYDELRDCILIYLHNLFVSSTVQAKCNILSMLGKLSVNIVLTYYFRKIKGIPFIFSDLTIKWKFEELIIKLYDYLTKLASLGLTIEKYNPLLIHTLIKIHESIMYTEEKCEIKIWEISILLCYSGLFTSNPTCLMRICRLFNRFPHYVCQNVLKDYVNCLFHKKAFDMTQENSIFYNFNNTHILNQLVTNINESLIWENHLALSCFNYTFKEMKKSEKDHFEDFVKHAQEHFLDIYMFLKINI